MSRLDPTPGAVDRSERAAVAVLLGASLLLGLVGLRWGLPNGDGVWSADALTPMAPLAAAYKLFGSRWNSGWFYYKYPLGQPLLLTMVYAPYLAWLWFSGGLRHPTSEYPYGFGDPERSLYALALLARGVSVLMTTGAVLFWYLTCRELFSWRAAWLSAWFLATMFPVVFYAHTTNVDGALLFWCTLSVYGAARVYSRGSDRLGMVLFGAAAAMALSTKELALGLVVTLALVVAARHLLRRRRSPGAPWLPAGTAAGLAVSIAVFVVMNGIPWNPLGMWHRALFLAGRLPEELRVKYAPHLTHVGTAAAKDLATEASQLVETLSECVDSTSWPVAVAALGGLVVFGWRTSGLFLVVAGVGYYLASLRSTEMLHLRYVLPLSMLATGLAGAGLQAAASGLRRRLGPLPPAALVAAFVVYSGFCGWDACRLLLDDTRYDAEAWMSAHAADASVEVYQRGTYLPRFLPTQHLSAVEFDQLSTTAFAARRPDIVVLSSAGLAGVTSRFKSDMDDSAGDGDDARSVSRRGASGDVIAYEYSRNRNFLDALEKGCLGYGLAARFEKRPLLAVGSIPSLAPTIRIYRRGEAASAGAADGAVCRALLSADQGRDVADERPEVR